MLWPSSPLSLPSPFGNRFDVELRRMNVEATVEAVQKMTRAKYSAGCFVSASMTRTPVARPFPSSNAMEWTIEYGRMVRLPVCSAAGSVTATLLK